MESDKRMEQVVLRWKRELSSKAQELEALRDKLEPQDLDMLRIQIQRELPI